MDMEFYHVFNRGVDKRDIFLDKRDCSRFTHDLFEFNDVANAHNNNARLVHVQLGDIRCPPVGRMLERQKREPLVRVHAFCLMPNHYHLLLSPAVENGISLFMKKLNMGYAKYFNEKYERGGALFQGKYKKVHIQNDRHFMCIPFYIHFNPLDLEMPEWRKGNVQNVKHALQYLESYKWSSHLDYLGVKNLPSLTQRTLLTEYFQTLGGYRKALVNNIKNFQIESVESIALE